MAQGRPYGSTEEAEAAGMRAAAEQLFQLHQVPRALQAAVAHTLHAAANELDNGRPLPIEVRRAARHVVKAIGEVAAGLGG